MNTRKRLFIAIAAMTIFFAYAQSASNYTFKNRWKGTYLSHGKRLYGTGTNPKSEGVQWQFEPVAGAKGYYKIKNNGTGKYLNIEHGKLECSDIEQGWHSAQWGFEPAEKGYFRLKNRWKGTYIHIEHGAPECSDIKSAWWSAQWERTIVKNTTKTTNTSKKATTSDYSERAKMFEKGATLMYSSGTMVSSTKGSATVTKKDASSITLRVKAVRHMSDVKPGTPTDVDVNTTMILTYANGKYFYEMEDASGKGNVEGKFSNDNKSVSFSGDQYGISLYAIENICSYLSENNPYLTTLCGKMTYRDIQYAVAEGCIPETLSKSECSGIVIKMVNGAINNENEKVRKAIYDELLKVEYQKANFLTKTLLDQYFPGMEKQEKSAALKSKLSAIHKKMKTAK